VFLARKITRAKWERTSKLKPGEIPADAVTGDLRTYDNGLSLWRCGSGSEREVENAVLALASGSDRIEKMDIVWIDEEDLRSAGQFLADSQGRTPVRDLVDQHVDLQRLDFERLGKVARLIVSALHDKQCRTATKRQIKELLISAVNEDRVSTNELKEKVRQQIQQQ